MNFLINLLGLEIVVLSKTLSYGNGLKTRFEKLGPVVVHGFMKFGIDLKTCAVIQIKSSVLILEVCRPNEFKCTQQFQCIPKNQRCDKKKNCRDGSDELGCPKPRRMTQTQKRTLIHTQAHAQTNTHTYTQAHTQTNTHTYTHAHTRARTKCQVFFVFSMHLTLESALRISFFQ